MGDLKKIFTIQTIALLKTAENLEESFRAEETCCLSYSNVKTLVKTVRKKFYSV